MHVDLDHPANAGVLRYLTSLGRQGKSGPSAHRPIECTPSEVANFYESLRPMPDSIIRLWDRITVKLPSDCRALVYRSPILVHPVSGVIFGFVNSIRTYALRLPPTERLAALRAGAHRIEHYR